MWDKRQELMGLIVCCVAVSLYWTPILAQTEAANGITMGETHRAALLA